MKQIKGFQLGLITILILMFGCTTNQSNEKKLYTQAQKLIDSHTGKTSVLKDAYDLIRQISSMNPESEYAYVGYGRLSYKSGYRNRLNFDGISLDKAEEYFAKAIKINKEFYDAYRYGAYNYVFMKYYVMAKKFAEEAERIYPDSPKT